MIHTRQALRSSGGNRTITIIQDLSIDNYGYSCYSIIVNKQKPVSAGTADGLDTMPEAENLPTASIIPEHAT